MNKEQKLITLDTEYGFGIYVPNATIKARGAEKKNIRRCGNYAANKDNNPLMFKNHKIAITYAKNCLHFNSREFKINVIKFSRKKRKIYTIAKFEEMQEFSNNTYQYINDDMIYYIKEQYIDVVNSIQYIVFENGDSVRSEEKYGKPRQRQLFDYVREAAIYAFYYTGDIDGVSSPTNEELVITFKNSTAKIHIVTNSYIARLNVLRKEDPTSSQFQRCLPFNKAMDKYLTFYTWVSKNNAEPDNFGFEGDIDNTIIGIYNYILDYLEDIAKEEDKPVPEYSSVEFKGVILTRDV